MTKRVGSFDPVHLNSTAATPAAEFVEWRARVTMRAVGEADTPTTAVSDWHVSGGLVATGEAGWAAAEQLRPPSAQPQR
jgi:hypothetical protein